MKNKTMIIFAKIVYAKILRALAIKAIDDPNSELDELTVRILDIIFEYEDKDKGESDE